jgi:hypothetical protein
MNNDPDGFWLTADHIVQGAVIYTYGNMSDGNRPDNPLYSLSMKDA